MDNITSYLLIIIIRKCFELVLISRVLQVTRGISITQVKKN